MSFWNNSSSEDLIISLDGFLSAGDVSSLVATVLRDRDHDVLIEFDLDDYYDYRSRRPPIGFRRDHYHSLGNVELQLVRAADDNGKSFLFLSGPEPDFAWNRFATTVTDFIEKHRVGLTLSLGGVPMTVPHTRPVVLTSHGTSPDLVDRENVFQADIFVPSSMHSYLEYSLGELGHQAAGYVAHVPHYAAQMPYPAAALSLLEATQSRMGLRFDLDELRELASSVHGDLQEQVEMKDGGLMVAEMEQQYDTLVRVNSDSLLDIGPIPSADDLAQEFEQFLAAQDKRTEED